MQYLERSFGSIYLLDKNLAKGDIEKKKAARAEARNKAKLSRKPSAPAKPTSPDIECSDDEFSGIDENMCAKCHKTYKRHEVSMWIGCDSCERWYHKRCTDIMNVDDLTDSTVISMTWHGMR